MVSTMTNYIDTEKLTTIIEERKAQQDLWINRYHDPINQGISHELTEILSIITSLQQEQPKVDLDKEITHIWGKCATEPNDQFACLHIESFIEIARHFAEWGAIHFNARKEN